MSYLVLARKYRPLNFEEVVAQPHITGTLQNAIKQGRVAHAICLAGPRGTGKTTVARILAKAMNCEQGPTPHPCGQCASCREITSGNAVDVYEIDGASNNSVEQVRELRENVQYSPALGHYKVYIVDEVHMLSPAAFNALLKTLEEPPAHVMFILATTESHKIPVTILSRCQRYDFKRISLDDIVNHLEKLSAKENFSIEKESLWAVARQSGGCMRDALSLLDQVMAYTTGQASMEQVLDILGVADRRSLFALAAALLARDATACLNAVDDLYQKGHDLKHVMGDLVEHVRNLAVVKMVQDPAPLLDVPPNEIKAMQDQAQQVSLSFLRTVLSLLFKEEAQVRMSTQPRLALEVALIRICEITPAVAIDALIEKLDELASRPASYVQAAAPSAPSVSAADQAAPLAAPAPAMEAPQALPQAPQPPLAPESPPPVLEDIPDPAQEAPPQAQAQEAPPSPTPPPLAGDPWEAFAGAASNKSIMLGKHLERCRLRDYSDGLFIVETDGSPLCRDALNKRENLDILQNVCKDLMGPQARVEIVEPQGESRPEPSQSQAGRKREMEQEALNHPLVQEAAALFRGRVIEVKEL